MALGKIQHSQAAVDRGIQAEESFRRLLGGAVVRSSPITDRLEHFDFNVKYDVKKIRSTDEFGESDYHWIELMNVNGNAGWLYGRADYFAFETKRYWIIVDKATLQAFIDKMVTNTELTFEKQVYRIYRRRDRLDRVVMVPTLDLAFLGFMIEKDGSSKV